MRQFLLSSRYSAANHVNYIFVSWVCHIRLLFLIIRPSPNVRRYMSM